MESVLSRLVTLAAAIVVAAAFGLWWRARQGRVRAVPVGTGSREHPVGPAELGQPRGDRVTLLQFSSSACAPCRTTGRLLAELVDPGAGIAHIDLDAEQHLDLVRRLSVLRTPTVLVLDADGRPVHRITGVPDMAALRAALAALTGPLPPVPDPAMIAPVPAQEGR